MVGVDAAGGLGVHASDLRARQVSHYVNIVRGKVDHDSNVAHAWRKWTQAPGVDLEDTSQVACL